MNKQAALLRTLCFTLGNDALGVRRSRNKQPSTSGEPLFRDHSDMYVCMYVCMYVHKLAPRPATV
jgi:hypothetical protein